MYTYIDRYSLFKDETSLVLLFQEWANDDSVTQRISVLSQMGPLAQAKQFIAEKLAGDYDRERISKLIEEKIESNKPFGMSFEASQGLLRALMGSEDYDVLLLHLSILLAGKANPPRRLR